MKSLTPNVVLGKIIEYLAYIDISQKANDS